MTNKEKYDQVFIDSFSITSDQLNEFNRRVDLEKIKVIGLK
jgi:hypothetical protein